MAPRYRYALVVLLCALLAGSYAGVYRAGEAAGESAAPPIVIHEVPPTPPLLVPAPTPAIAVSRSNPPSTHRPERGGGVAKLKNPGDGFVDVNTASAEELERLPGVGPKMAAKVVAYRQQAGPLHKAADLMNVPGIGDKKLAKMAPYLRF